MTRYDPEVAAEVLARAAALQAAAPGDEGPGLDEDAVLAVGREVGLTEDAVRRALAEHRTGSALAPVPVPADRLLGPAVVAVDRVLPRSPALVLAGMESGLRRALLERRRSLPHGSVWTPRSGPLTTVRRKVSPPGPLAWVSRLDLQVAAVGDGRTRVQVVARCDPRRRGHAASAVGGLTVAVAGTGAAVGLAVGLDPLWLLGAPVTLGTGLTSAAAARGSWSRTRSELALSVQGLLDGV